MDTDSDKPDRFSPDEALPEVQPPSAGFIIQLFVIPGLIVLVMVVVWMVINGLSQTDSPEQSLEKIRARRRDRWQAAINLAAALSPRDETYKHLKFDSQFATRMAAVLTQEVERDGNDEGDVKMRMYLARALGEVYVVDGLEALIGAADEAKESKLDVRLSAIEAIALLADNVRKPLVDDLLGEIGRACETLAPKADAPLAEFLTGVAIEVKQLRRSAQRQPELAARARELSAKVHDAADRLAQADGVASAENIAELRAAADRMIQQSAHLESKHWSANGALAAVLFEAAQTEDDEFKEKYVDENGKPQQRNIGHRLRERAAYAMGLIGGTRLLDRLQLTLIDGYSNVRFNAATGLARHGRTAAVEGLIEMLDPDESKFAELHSDPRRREQSLIARKRALIIGNGLEAVRLLASANESDSLGELIVALEKVTGEEENNSSEVRVEAEAVLKVLREREAELAGKS